MATTTVTQVKAELKALQDAVSDLLEEYREDLCEEGLAAAAEVLSPLGVRFPGKNYRAHLSDVRVEGLTPGGGSLSRYGDTSAEFDSAFNQALSAKLGPGAKLEFKVGNDNVEVYFGDTTLTDLDEDF